MLTPVPRRPAKVHKPVFVDRYGRRRRAVIGTGLVLGVLLVAYLLVMGVSFAAVLGGGARPAVGPVGRVA
jgi:hypothetical protein